jgi:ribosomal protein S27AE
MKIFSKLFNGSKPLEVSHQLRDYLEEKLKNCPECGSHFYHLGPDDDRYLYCPQCNYTEGV